MTSATWLAFALSLAPADATRAACAVLSYKTCDEVLAIMHRESRGVAVGVHVGHHRRVHGAVFWSRAVQAGWLSPETCPAHARGDGSAWGPRGAHGLVAAYSVRWLGDCIAPAVLDLPLVSAVVTVRRLADLARRYGLRTAGARAEAWRVGVRGAGNNR